MTNPLPDRALFAMLLNLAKRPVLAYIASVVLGLTGLGAIVTANVTMPDVNAVTPLDQRNGWTPEAVEEMEPVFGDPPPLLIEQPEDVSTAGAQVYLWDYEKQINGGENFPCMRQETGDCVSFGAARALRAAQAVQICVHRAHIDFKDVFPPWIYGVGRTANDIGNGKLGRSPGMVGRWAVEALTKYGAIPADDPALPKYSGSLADTWGRSGPPKDLFDKASQHKLQAYAKVTTYNEARDAICNGYPVTVASNQGFKMQPVEHAGKMWGVPSGRWNHQMCFIGVDDLAEAPNGERGGLRIQNSWGASAHGTPLNGEPAGGFWVDRKTCDRMLGQNDSYAVSLFDGFPYRPLNFHTFTADTEIDVCHLPDPLPGLRPLSESLCDCPSHCAQCGGELISFLGAVCALIGSHRNQGLRRQQAISPPHTAA